MKTIRGKEITFKRYLQLGYERKAFGDTPESDFAWDALHDQDFRDFTRWEELRFYLVFNRAVPEAIEAAEKLFRRWKVGQ